MEDNEPTKKGEIPTGLAFIIIIVLAGGFLWIVFAANQPPPLEPPVENAAIPQTSGRVESELVEEATPVEPTERSLKAASQAYVYSDQNAQKDFVKQWSDGTGKPTDAIRNIAVTLDENPESLILLEEFLSNYNQNKRIPARSINCFSNQIGNTTYTNCY